MQPFEHRTVLRREAVDLLAPAPGKVFLDGTLGGGGHAEALLDAGARVIGLDQDPAALRAARVRLAARGERFVAEQANFRDARSVLDRLGVREVDGALVDLGLARIVGTHGEERFARPIARAIHRAHREGKLTDTAQLAEVVARSIPRKAWPRDLHPATRTFQALRIAVNDELGALSDFVGDLPRIVARGGRAAAISFHSLEDRVVKQGFAQLATGCICPPRLPVCSCGRVAQWKVLTRKAVQTSEAEQRENPRSRSARLRAVERLA